VHNLIVIASRRSGSTWLWNCTFDLVRSRWPDATWEREYEPFEWGTIEMQGHTIKADRTHARQRHGRLPLFTDSKFRAPSLALMLSTSCDVKIIKLNVGLGRAPAIRAYPNTTLIHLVRDPQEVLSSLRHEKFNLASGDWFTYFKQYAPWLQAEGNPLIWNAVRWAHDNRAVQGHSDLLISYNHLLDNPRPAFEALDALIVEKLGDHLGGGKQPDIERFCGRVRRSTRKNLLTQQEKSLTDAICGPVWRILSAKGVVRRKGDAL
jgi:hypothetical protein